MDPILNNRDDDSERLAGRLERIERMRREKQRQEKKRRMIKKLLPLGVGVFGVIIIIICAVTAFGRKPEESGVKSQPKPAEQNLVTDKPSAQDDTAQAANMPAQDDTAQAANMPAQDSTAPVANLSGEESTGAGANASENENTDAGLSKHQDGISVVEAGMEELENVTPVYSFKETADTATVYSDEIISTNIILIDESTDTIVASKGARERINPASMTKVLTALVAAEHITEENLDETFTMTSEITDYAYVNDCSSVGFLDGEQVTVRDLFYGTILPSGGDAAVGLATYVAGSQEAFVDMMNEKLKELGLSESAHFTNCVGLYDENHYCSVYDMAVIMKAAIQNELCREVLSAHTYTTTVTAEHPEGIIISNWFLRRIEDKDTGGEVLCAKTGYVVESGSCAASYGTFAGGKPYICVTAGSSSSWRCIYDHVDIYNQYVKE